MLREKFIGSVKITSVDYSRLLCALKKAAHYIVNRHPQVKRVLLFGSFARGDYLPSSDVDILVEVNNTALPFLERRDQFIGYFDLPFDVNLLVYTSEEIKKLTEQNNSFITNVLQEARELSRLKEE